MHQAVLIPQPKPAPLERDQLERCGLGPRMHRNYQDQPLVRRWTEPIALSIAVGAGASAHIASRILHQPFRITEIHMQSPGATPSLFAWALVAQHDDGTILDAQLAQMHSLLTTYRTSSTGGYALGTDLGTSCYPGTVIRAVPTRLIFLVTNGAAGAISQCCMVTVEHLGFLNNPEPFAPAAAPYSPCASCRGV